MTDNEIIKALECCTTFPERMCGKCTLQEECLTELCVAEKNALDLINRQKAEIERLEELVYLADSETANVRDLYFEEKSERAEAIKEFAERLKANEREHCQWCNHSNKGSRSEWCDELIDGHCRCLGFSKFESKLDNLVKEMVGADNG